MHYLNVRGNCRSALQDRTEAADWSAQHGVKQHYDLEATQHLLADS